MKQIFKKITTIVTAVATMLSMSVATISADEWVKTDTGYKYELDNGSYQKKGWLTVGTNKYYINSKGVRATGSLAFTDKNGTKTYYYFDSTGKMVKSKWVTISGQKYYYRSNGKRAVSITLIISGNKYSFGKDGKLSTSKDFVNNGKTITYNGSTYTILNVDGGDMSGSREANVAVDVGYGDRTYWGFTNKYGQLVTVIADKIVLQDDNNEPVNKSGRYYNDEASVPGTESKYLDKGHVIADSLGGVSNAYNITPQNSTLNRYGDQAYMEKVIRDAGGCTNFVATITYPDTKTQIPSHYHFEYDMKGNHIVDDFDNVNPEEATKTTNTTKSSTTSSSGGSEDISSIDTNHNGIVTIAEAKATGFTMPIKSSHWLYKYMIDRDGDGMVGE